MNIIKDKLGVWLATIIVALLTIFSDKILEHIRFRLNVVDLRTKYFEELAVNLSTYLFWSEIYHERHQKHWADNPDDMDAIGENINAAVTTITTKEYVYRTWVRRYWDPAAVKQFDEVITAVKSVDDAIHAFNDAGKEEEKTIELGKRLDTLRAKIDQWLVHYSRNQSLELPEVVAVDESEPLGMIPMSSTKGQSIVNQRLLRRSSRLASNKLAGASEMRFRFLKCRMIRHNAPMAPLLSGDCEGHERIRRNSSVKYYREIPSISR